jgi:hypothetical protein
MDAAARESINRAKAGQEADLHPNDILKSMAACLVQDNSSIYHVTTLPDRQPPEMDSIKKPPKEIFYRKTQLFATRVPGEVGPKRCSCQYLCTGAPAVIKCLSCVMYDPKGTGFFCKLCFDARHPWYRVPHIFNEIESDESIQHTLKVSHRRAEMVRYEKEGQELMKDLLKNKPKLDYVADDNRVSFNLKDAGYRTIALENQMREYRKKLRIDIRSKPLEHDAEKYPTGVYKVPMNDDEAAIIVGRAYRGFKVRNVLSTFIMNRIVRGHDHKTGKEFYYDKVTKKSSWQKPHLLMEKHVKQMTVKSTLDKEKKRLAAIEAVAKAKKEKEEAERREIEAAEEEERGRKKDPYAVKAGKKSYKSSKHGAASTGTGKTPPGSPTRAKSGSPGKSKSPDRKRRGGVAIGKMQG